MFWQQEKRIIRKIAEEFNVIGKQYHNEDIELNFEFTGNNFDESFNKQKKNYKSLAKLFSCFDFVIDSAIGIETHRREGG